MQLSELFLPILESFKDRFLSIYFFKQWRLWEEKKRRRDGPPLRNFSICSLLIKNILNFTPWLSVTTFLKKLWPNPKTLDSNILESNTL